MGENVPEANNPVPTPVNSEKSGPNDPSRRRFMKVGGGALGAAAMGAVLPKTAEAQGLFDPVPLPPKQPAKGNPPSIFSDKPPFLSPPDFLSVPETGATLNAKLRHLESSISTVLPDYVSKPRISLKPGTEYYIYSSTGSIPDKGFLPTVNGFSPGLSKNSLDYMGLRIAEEMFRLTNEIKDGEPVKMMVKFYEENLGRSFAQDYKEIAPVLDINKFVDITRINDKTDLNAKEDLATKAYAQGFSRIWMEPDEFMKQVNNLHSQAATVHVANLGLSIIWATIDSASSPTTVSSLGVRESLVNELMIVSGKKGEWQKIFKK